MSVVYKQHAHELIREQSGCSLQEAYVNSDVTMGSVQNGVHHAFFLAWMQDVVSFILKICQETECRQREGAKLDRNNGKEIKCGFCWYMFALSQYFWICNSKKSKIIIVKTINYVYNVYFISSNPLL